MGNVNNQQVAIDAQKNIQKTWEELLAKVKVDDRDQPLGTILKNDILFDGYHYFGFNPLDSESHPAVAVCKWIY